MKTGLNYHRLILLTGLLSSLTPEGGVHGCLCLLNHPLPHKHPHCNTFFFLYRSVTFERNNGSNYLSTREQESNSSVVNKIARDPCSKWGYSYGIQGSRDWSQAVWGRLWHKPTSLGVCIAGVRERTGASSGAWGTGCCRCSQGLPKVVLPAVRENKKPQQCDRKSEANIGVGPCCKQKDCQAWRAHELLWILRGP